MTVGIRKWARFGIAVTCFAALFVSGCGDGTVNTGVAQDPTATAAPGMSGGTSAAPQTSPTGQRLYNVTIYTSAAILYIDDLELEFNRRRGIHGFYGFIEDDFSKMIQVSWDGIARIDFGQVISETLFEQVINRREDQNLVREQIFETQLRYHDQTVQLFYAIIPKLRGWKNQQIWELGMTNNQAGIIYMEFDR